MVFNVHYLDDPALYFKAYGKTVERGTIMSYQEGPDVTSDDELPLACKVLSYPTVVPVWDPTTFMLTHRVDVGALELVPIKPPPKPVRLKSDQ